MIATFYEVEQGKADAKYFRGNLNMKALEDVVINLIDFLACVDDPRNAKVAGKTNDSWKDVRFQKESGSEYAATHKSLLQTFFKLNRERNRGKLDLRNFHISQLI